MPNVRTSLKKQSVCRRKSVRQLSKIKCCLDGLQSSAHWQRHLHTAESSPALSAPRHSLRSARVCLQMCPFCRKGTFLFKVIFNSSGRSIRYFERSAEQKRVAMCQWRVTNNSILILTDLSVRTSPACYFGRKP